MVTIVPAVAVANGVVVGLTVLAFDVVCVVGASVLNVVVLVVLSVKHTDIHNDKPTNKTSVIVPC